MPNPRRSKGRKDTDKSAIRQSIIETLMKVEGEEYRPIHNLDGRYRYYLLLTIAKHHAIDGLTPAEVEYILKKRLMIKGIHRSNIRRDLRGSTALVERFPLGRGYAYRITIDGEGHLKSVLGNTW